MLVVKRRGVARVLVIAFVGTAFLSAGLPGGTQAQTPRPPNILLVVTDEQRASLVGMPTTKSWLLRGGLHYQRAFVTTPTCCPSRASIMTGLYAHNHGVKSNTANAIDHFDHNRTIQAWLDQAGYRTGVFGKFLNKWPLEQTPPHFDEWAITNRKTYYNGNWNVNGTIQRNLKTYSTKFIGDNALSFIQQAEQDLDEPWFAYIAPVAAHAPFTAEDIYRGVPLSHWEGNPAVSERLKWDKPRYVRRAHKDLSWGRQVRRKQLRTLMSVDDMMGRLRALLSSLGQLENTIVIFTSDNGYLWAEHGLGAKDHPYTQSIKVPLLLSWSGTVPAGATDRRLAANIDIAPTVLDAAGIRRPTPLDGRSLLNPSWRRNRILIEHWCNIGRCRYWASTRGSSYQYTAYFYDVSMRVVEFQEYYRLNTDPWQLENVLAGGRKADDPDVELLHRRLRADLRCSGRECP